MQRIALLLVLATAMSCFVGCATDNSRDRFGPAEGLDLDRVVLYRNGVGYFERRGKVEGDRLQIKCRKDQVNDILKSLTVVDRKSGKAVSVSMPLDPQSWANAALTTLKPGSGSLGEVLDALRGTWVTLRTPKKAVSGRILMVETVPAGDGKFDRQISLLEGDAVHVVLLSQVNRVRFQDGELALQLNRSLDVTAGEGIFQQVTVDVRLAGAKKHDILLSYVVAAPIWKPTYRIVLPDDGDEALLQAWAVVDNISGEDWTKVGMSLTSGAPIAFRFDLHTPRNVGRPDMSALGWSRRARVAQGESSLPSADPAPKSEVARSRSARERNRYADKAKKKGGYGRGGGGAALGGAMAPAEAEASGDFFYDADGEEADDSGIVLDELRRSTSVKTRATQVSGLTRYDIDGRVTVPDGTSTMVAILNEGVTAEQTFLYTPGGGGAGYEQNPYRVVRFQNSTPFVLETGPISIYAGGSFVGEGIAKTIAADASTTIPFSVEHEIIVTSKIANNSGSARLIRMVGGVLTIETWQRHVTTWNVRAPKQDKKRKVLVRQSKYGNYELKERPEGTEDVAGAYLIPVWVEAGKTEGELEVVERTPARRSVSIWDNTSAKVLSALLEADNVDPAMMAKLKPIIEKRKEIADIDREVANLKRRQRELDQRADQTRRNLEAIKKDPAAGKLRGRLNRRLDEFTREGDSIGRKVVELTSRRLERKIEIDELVEGLKVEIK